MSTGLHLPTANAAICSLLPTLSAPRHGDFPRSIWGSNPPGRCTAKLCFPCPLKRATTTAASACSHRSVPPATRSRVMRMEGMGRVSPVLIALQEERSQHFRAAAKTACNHPNSAHSLVAYGERRRPQSPADTLCPKARGLSSQRLWEWPPGKCTAKPCFPCPPSGGTPTSASFMFKQHQEATIW